MTLPKPNRTFLKVIGVLMIMALGPASVYFLYNRTGGPASRDELVFQRNLRFLFMAGTPTVDVAPLTTWPWVTLCAVDTGTSAEALTDLLGFAYRDYDQMSWIQLPDYWTLLFVDADVEADYGRHYRRVTPIRIPRRDLADAAFANGTKGICVPRDHALLNVEHRDAAVGQTPVIVKLGSAN